MGIDSNDENSTAKLEMQEESAYEGSSILYSDRYLGKNYYV